MQPYVVCQGDHLALLAYQFGFDADTVWNHPKNADLSKARPDPSILAPTDILYIPTPAAPVSHDLAIGQTNTFVSNPPQISISVKFVGDDDSSYAGKAFTIAELDFLTGLTTDGDGVAAFPAPVTLETATLTFTDSGEGWTLRVGSLDPVSTISGIFQRLQHLGYISLSATVNGDDLTELRRGLYYLKAQQTPPPPDSGGDDDSDGGADSSGTGYSDGSAGASDDGDDSGEVNLSFADDLWCCPAGSGIADDGTLDASLASLLVDQHGA